MGKEAGDNVSVSIHPVDGEWTPNHSQTWGNDVVEMRGKRWSWAWTWGARNRWTSARRTTEQRVTPALQSTRETLLPALTATWTFICLNLWPFLLRILTAKKQWFALFLFLAGGATPMVVLGWFTPRPESASGTWPPYYNVFAAKYMSCGNSAIDEDPANSTITGFEGLFVLDQTWGHFSFSTVKTIDVAWDILVGRGIQMLAWSIAYVVFSDALLRVIERHPASFRIFQRIALEGPSLLSLWSLSKELLSVRSKRTRSLFAYFLVSTTYVLIIPMFLGAMTGYDSTSIAWVDLDDSNNIVPTSAIKYAWVITGTRNTTLDTPICADPDDYSVQANYVVPRTQHCSCKTMNGTLEPPDTFYYSGSFNLSRSEGYIPHGTACLFNYPGQSGTWEDSKYDPETGSYDKKTTYKCNDTATYKINGRQYDVQDINATYSLCYNNKAYDVWDLQGRTRCLPDTANPSYQWGFSTMLSGVFVFIHFGWCLSMYIVWLDAQSKSTLVQEGYGMTPLRAAFAIAKAVKRRTGLEEKQLVRHNTKDLNKELDGARKEKGTEIDYSIFVANTEEDAEEDRQIRRRRALALDGLPS